MLTEFSHLIKFPWGQDRKVFKTQRRDMRYAKDGEVFMRCGNCGATDFTVILRPTVLGDTAKVTTISCSTCNKTFQLDDQGALGGTLKFEKADARKREMINERPDT